MYYCPICRKQHEVIPYCCDCGYQENKKITDELFNVYKFTKSIVAGKVSWTTQDYDSQNIDDTIVITDVNNVDYSIVLLQSKSRLRTTIEDGILAYNKKCLSLIIDVDEIGYDLLDESNVKMLFIGKRLKVIKNNFLNQYKGIKYINVDSNNKFFSATNNVLFNKDQTVLVTYPRLKNELEYTIRKV